MKLLIRSLLICSLFFFSCKSTKDSANGSMQQQSFEELVKSKYPEQSTVLFNESQTYALVQSIAKKSDVRGQSSINFFVFDKAAEEIILEDFITKGSVEWASDNSLKIKKIPGQYKEGVSVGYTYDVSKRMKEAIKFTD